jgi:hypothetical protein
MTNKDTECISVWNYRRKIMSVYLESIEGGILLNLFPVSSKDLILSLVNL